MSSRLWLACLLIVLSAPMVRAQEEKDDKEKKAIQDLISRAEDEYRQYFKRPETGIQFWGAIKFEMETGKYDLAAFHIQEMLKKPAEAIDPDLLKVEKAEGLNAFLRLQTVRQWHKNEKLQAEAEKNIQTLITRVSAALEKHLSDPVRLEKFIKQLNAPTTEERTFAFVELARSRERAVPYLVQALRTNVGTPLYGKIRDAMTRLEPEIVPPLLEILRAADAKDALEMDLRPTVLEIIRRRSDKRAIPYLWHLSEAKQYPEPLRKQARIALSQLLETDISLLPPSKNALTDLGEKYFQHRVKFKSGAGVRLWPWDGQKIPLKPTELSQTAAEEYFAKRYAKEALDLDSAYQPAQRLLLSVTLERGFNRNVDEFILKPMQPAHQQLLATIDAELLAQVLERALEDGNVPVILPAVQALGDRGDTRAARLGAGGAPRGLLRALYYPDRRVQFVALRAALKMPNHPGPAASMRIVDLLRRFGAAEGKPKALLAYVPDEQAADARKAIAELGFEPVLVKNIRAGFDKLQATADFDVLMLGSALPEKELPYVLAQLRGDADHGRLPLVVFTPKDKQEAVARYVDRYRLSKILPDSFLTSSEELKGALESFLQEGSAAVSGAERKEINRVAMDTLLRMARGEITGYDVRPAQETVIQTLRSPDQELALEAVEILGRLPGREPQTRLAALVTDAAKEKLRMPAAIELNRSVQKYGLLLDKNQVKDLKSAFQAAKAEDPVRAQLALFLGNLRTTPAATGQQLSNFRPDPTPLPKKDKEKEKEKEKDENS